MDAFDIHLCINNFILFLFVVVQHYLNQYGIVILLLLLLNFSPLIILLIAVALLYGLHHVHSRSCSWLLARSLKLFA